MGLEGALRRELGATIRLAWPVVLAEVGWMVMGVVDTLMVGVLGSAAIGAVGLASTLYGALAIFGFGLLLGLDPLVSQAYGAGKNDEAWRWLVHGLVLAALLVMPLMGIVMLALPALSMLGLSGEVLHPTRSYMEVVVWGTAPLLAFTAIRRYLQAVGVVRPITVALVTANLANWLANYALIEGRLGMPALGVAGAAWASVVSRFYMLAVLVVTLCLSGLWRGQAGRWKIELGRIRGLVLLGVPAGFQHLAEYGVFTMATVMVGRLGAVPLAAHQVALVLAGLTFMMPLGVSSAGAVRVGHAIGRKDLQAASRAGMAALVVGTGLMALAALMFWTLPRTLYALFNAQADVTAIGVRLLAIVAAFQLFDGIQVVSTGILRGAGDTKTPMITNMIGHWLVGLPVGAYLCFGSGLGVLGIWVGLSLGLTVVALVLLVVWMRRVLGWRKGNLAPLDQEF